jgi:hypothetical protein
MKARLSPLRVLEVAPHARAQALGLADVDDRALLVLEEVDAGLHQGGQPQSSLGCFRLIANAGIARVYFGEFYRDPRIFDVAARLGIDLIDMSKQAPPTPKASAT